MRVGVFGGAGFIGRNLLDALSVQQMSFLSLDRFAAEGYEGCSKIIDFSDVGSYEAHLAGLNVVVLLISSSVPNTFTKSILSEVTSNVLPYARLLESLRTRGVERIVYLSSGGGVYGDVGKRAVDETAHTSPVNHYGCAKLMIEEMIRTSARLDGWGYTILRPANPIGRYQKFVGQGLVPAAIDACLSGKAMTIWGDGTMTRDYFDVKDLASTLVDLIRTGFAENMTLNIGSGVGKTVNEVITLVEQACGARINRTYVEKGSNHVDFNVLDISRLRRLTGRQPKEISVDLIKEMISERKR